MNYTIRITVVVTVLGILLAAGCGAGSRSATGHVNRIRFEHVALNVEDSIATAQWYRDNLGLKIIREGEPPGNKRFVADPGGKIRAESLGPGQGSTFQVRLPLVDERLPTDQRKEI